MGRIPPSAGSAQAQATHPARLCRPQRCSRDFTQQPRLDPARRLNVERRLTMKAAHPEIVGDPHYLVAMRLGTLDPVGSSRNLNHSLDHAMHSPSAFEYPTFGPDRTHGKQMTMSTALLEPVAKVTLLTACSQGRLARPPGSCFGARAAKPPRWGRGPSPSFDRMAVTRTPAARVSFRSSHPRPS